MSVRLVRRGGPRSCAWCHERVGVAARCDTCGTALHDACALEHGRCPTLGCAGALELRGRAPMAPARPVVGAGVLALLLVTVAGAGGLQLLAPAWRRQAAAGPQGEAERLEAMFRGLADPDPLWRDAATLGLRNALGDRDLPPGVRARAGAALARVAALDPDEDVRRGAGVRLVAAFFREQGTALPLDDPSPAVRAACLRALAAAPLALEPADVALILQHVDPAREPSAGVRARAALSLAPVRYEAGVVEALTRAADEDEEPRVRDVALAALGGLGRDWQEHADRQPDARALARLGRGAAAADPLLQAACTDALLQAPAHTLAAFVAVADLAGLPQPTRQALIDRLERDGRTFGLASCLGGCVELLEPPVAGLRLLAERDPSPFLALEAESALRRLHGEWGPVEGAAQQAARCRPEPREPGSTCGFTTTLHSTECELVRAEADARRRWVTATPTRAAVHRAGAACTDPAACRPAHR